MTAVRINWKKSPDNEYCAWASRTGALFADPSWVEPIASALGARPLYGFHPERGEGVAVQMFRYFGLSIGYAGLPISPGWLSDADCRSQITVPGLHITRFSLSCLRPATSVSNSEHAIELPESVIPCLQVWPKRNARKLKKDRAFARRSRVKVAALDVTLAGQMESLYRATVTRHRGSLRYHEGYFRAVIALSAKTSRVLARGAFDEAGRLAGFAIFGLDGTTAHYLHGAVADDARTFGVSDLLLGDAMDRAVELGAESVTLLPSPERQSGLIAFKCKWGEIDGQWLSLERSNGILGEAVHLGMKLATKLKSNVGVGEGRIPGAGSKV